MEIHSYTCCTLLKLKLAFTAMHPGIDIANCMKISPIQFAIAMWSSTQTGELQIYETHAIRINTGVAISLPIS